MKQLQKLSSPATLLAHAGRSYLLQRCRLCHAHSKLSWRVIRRELIELPSIRTMWLEKNWNHKDRNNVDHLDHRINRGPGGVLVGITHSVSGDGCGMR